MADSAERVGQRGEQLFRALLDKTAQPYIYIDQKRESVSNAFWNKTGAKYAKRPDFLLSVNGFGTITVDAKHQKLHEKLGSKPHFFISESEVNEARAFSHLFGLPWWWVFKNNETTNNYWYWTSIKDIEFDMVYNAQRTAKLFIDDMTLVSEPDFVSANIYTLLFGKN